MAGRYNSLPIGRWPAADRHAWQTACQPPVRLQRGGRAGHLKASTRIGLERSYGYLLDFCARSGMPTDDRDVAASVTPATIEGFRAELEDRVRPVTRALYLQRIMTIARYLDPQRDLSWLRDMVLDLKDVAVPRSRQHRIVFSNLLFNAGINMMRRAQHDCRRTDLQRAQEYRNGLMIALLSLCPIRLRNLWSLDLGGRLARADDIWIVDIPAGETKNGRPDLRHLHPEITPWLDEWAETWRPLFHPTDNSMWPSIKGGRLAYTYIGSTISDVTRQELGVDVSPHLFRFCSVETVAVNKPAEMNVASANLHHSDQRVTEKHYNKGRMILAADAYRTLVVSIATDDG